MMKLEWGNRELTPKQGSHFPLPFFSFLETQKPCVRTPKHSRHYWTRELPKTVLLIPSSKNWAFNSVEVKWSCLGKTLMRTTKAFITEAEADVSKPVRCLREFGSAICCPINCHCISHYCSQSKCAISLILIPAPKGTDSVNEQKAITSMVLKLPSNS